MYGYPNVLTMLTFANIYAAVAIMMGLQTIGTARVNFGPQLYVGLGGYVASIFNLYFGLSPALTFILTILVSVAVALAISPIVLIARGLYFALITLLLPLIFLQITFIYAHIFGGEFGLSGMSPLIDLGRASWNYVTYCYLSLILMLIYLLIADKIMRSRFGISMAAINDNETAAEVLGVPVRNYKLFSYIFPSVCMAIVGWFIAHTFRTFSGVTYLSFFFLIKLLLIIIIGGRATLYGAVAGAYFIAVVEEFLRAFGPIHYVIFPILLIALVYMLPEGVWGIYHKRHYRDYYPKLRVRR